MMPDFLRTHVLAAYSAEFVAALFAAAVTLSFRRDFRRGDLLSWGAAWTSSTAFAGLGIVAHTLPWSIAQVTALRMVGRSGALLQAVLLLGGAYRLIAGTAPAWLRRTFFVVPVLATLSVLPSASGLPPRWELPSRAFASVVVGVASLVAGALLQRVRPPRPAIGIRLMGVGLALYGVLKVFSPMTLGRLGLLQGDFAGEALFFGFWLAPSTFALGCVVSLLEDRERVLAEERDRLRISEEKFAKLFRLSPYPILLMRPLAGGLIVDVNERFEALTGYARTRAIGATGVELGLFTQEQRSDFLRELLDTGRVLDREISVPRAQGPRIVSVSVESIEIEGELHALAIARDVTERRVAEQRLFDSEQRLRLALDAAQMGIWEWNTSTGSASWSSRVEDIVDVRGGSDCLDIGRGYLERLGSADRESLQRLVSETLEGQRDAFTHEHQVRGADGVLRWVETRAKAFRAAAGDVVLRGTVVDITERKQAEQALRMSEERLRRSERMAAVGGLVAGVAHEVRTPLFSISATLDAYEGQLDDPGERRAFLGLLRSQVGRLSGLMHDLLDYGRPPALRLARGEVESVIRRAVRSCSRLAREAGVQVEQLTAAAADFELLRDPDRLEQVFQNLLSNAIHHAPRGSVVRIHAVPRQLPERGLACSVEDEGPGLRHEDLPRLFEPFFSRRKGGIGLGLAIVQRIVEEHGGQIVASNRPDGGAAFSVFLAAPPACPA